MRLSLGSRQSLTQVRHEPIYRVSSNTRTNPMSYELAVMSAETDADMMPGSIVEQDADNRRIVIRLNGQVVGFYRYKDAA
jgi:hypothetical protein